MTKPEDQDYDRLYREFETALSKKIRAAAYVRDIGQHSWVSAEELESVIPQLRLNASGRVLVAGRADHWLFSPRKLDVAAAELI